MHMAAMNFSKGLQTHENSCLRSWRVLSLGKSDAMNKELHPRWPSLDPRHPAAGCEPWHFCVRGIVRDIRSQGWKVRCSSDYSPAPSGDYSSARWTLPKPQGLYVLSVLPTYRLLFPSSFVERWVWFKTILILILLNYFFLNIYKGILICLSMQCVLLQLCLTLHNCKHPWCLNGKGELSLKNNK